MRQRAAGIALCSGLLLTAFALPAQTPVEELTPATGVVQRAQALLLQGQHDSATELLGRHLAENQNDGHAWLLLGRIYLTDVRAWHHNGHPATTSSATLLDFASNSFEPAQSLLTDSGGVYRVMVAVERATLWAEKGGWNDVAAWKPDAEDLPLPPVLEELGRNLLASCARNGVLLTEGGTETVAAWGARLRGVRNDLILVRADMYRWDGQYRAHMAAALGADSAAELPAALAAAAATRPICLAPAVDSIAVAGVTWHPSRLVLASVVPPLQLTAQQVSQLSLFHFARTGLTGSVWTAAARDVYDLAARRNRALCTSLFVNTDALTLPAIPACTP